MMKSFQSEHKRQPKNKKSLCNSSKSSKFIEKESINGLSLTFSNIPTSLCDFIPNDQDPLSHEIDFDIAKNLRKLEKKDALTKQKSLTDLIQILKNKDEVSVISTLKFWPKLYNKLSLDEDKKVREQTQQLMGLYAQICGKEISSVIKQLLPTWIISQSDLHLPAANLAKETFVNTFPNQIKQEKAYLLCWHSIYEIILVNLCKNPPNIKSESGDFTTQEEAYIQDTVVNMRTIITLLPYLNGNEAALIDLVNLLKSKQFWLHSKQNISLIQAAYLQLGTDLLDILPKLVQTTPFIASNICECYRMIDNYHPHLISRIWTSIVKCGEHLAHNQIWKFVSFKSFFLPKFIKLLDCAAEGNLSHIYSCILPLFTQLPIDPTSDEAEGIYGQIFFAMIHGCDSSRVINNERESNCMIQMIFECSIYIIFVISIRAESIISGKIVSSLLSFTHLRLSESRFKKSTKIVADFVNFFIKPLITKGGIIPEERIINSIADWINSDHDENDRFCERVTELLLELGQSDNKAIKSFHDSLLRCIEPVLKLKIIKQQQHQCLVPYFYVCHALSTIKIDPSQADLIMNQCTHLMQSYNPAIIRIISRGIGLILSTNHQSLINNFIKSLSIEKLNNFYTKFYHDLIFNLTDIEIVSELASISLSIWLGAIDKSIEQLLNEDVDSSRNLSWQSIFDLCHTLSVHAGHDSVIISHLNSIIESLMDKYISGDTVDRLISLMRNCIMKLDTVSHLELLSSSFARNLLKLILCNSSTAELTNQNNLQPIFIYLKYCQPDVALQLSIELINEAINAQNCTQLLLVSHFIQSVIEYSLNDEIRQNLIDHISSQLIDDLISIDSNMTKQIKYSSTPVHTMHEIIIRIIHKINIIHSLQFPSLYTLINSASVLINSLSLTTFSSCHNSNYLLSQCDKVYKLVNDLDLVYYQDQLLQSAMYRTCQLNIFDRCPTLVLNSLSQLIPSNYSQWTPSFLNAVDMAINNWADNELNPLQLVLITRVLFPCAVKSRYLIQEIILATLTSYTSEDANPVIGNCNRALAIMNCLVRVDFSYFHLCFPLIMIMKPIFQFYINELHPAPIDQSSLRLDVDYFLLTDLLEFLSVGIDSNSTLAQVEWEFVFCLIDTLIRSEAFSNVENFRSNPITSDNVDHLLNSYWILKLISSVTVALASVKLDSVIDEWDNCFSDSIFTAILDQFSLYSGDHTIGKIIHSDLFVFYLESLSDAVSLCPVNIVLSHNFTGHISLNDPVDLPKDFLVVFNCLLESMSNYSLSVQLASYNCLLNLTEKLSEFLLEQVNAAEKLESLESFTINLPNKLLDYLNVNNIDQQNIDILENQVLLVRCFLTWNIVLQLFSGAQSKLRAEISTFLTQNDRCFDNFLNFCFTLMPKNPIVNKKNFSFIDSNNSCNLISEEPRIFSQCIEKRSKFIIYHLSSYIFRRSMQVLPNLCRNWWRSLDANSQQLVDSYVRQYLTRELFKIEFAQLKEIVDKEFNDKLEIKAIPMIGEVTVKYNVSYDQSLEQLIALPNNYPIGNIRVEFKKEMTVKIQHWKNWIGQMAMTVENQNGSIFDGVKLWKKNLDNYFNGIEECMICYSIIHATKYTVPSQACYQCRKKFHKDCLQKWFHSSTNPTCPNCRNMFYDGSQKLN